MVAPTYSGIVNLDTGTSTASIVAGILPGSSVSEFTSGFQFSFTVASSTFGRGWNQSSPLNCGQGSVFLLRPGRTGNGNEMPLRNHPDGMSAVLLSSATNWKKYLIASYDSIAPPYIGVASSVSTIIAAASLREIATSGSLDFTSVSRFEFHFDTTVNFTQAGGLFAGAYFCNIAISTNGDIATPATFYAMGLYVKNNIPGVAVGIGTDIFVPSIKSKSIFGFPTSIQIGDGTTSTRFVDKNFTLFFPSGTTVAEFNARTFDIQTPDNWWVFKIKPSPLDYIDISFSCSCETGFSFLIDSFAGSPTIKIDAALTNANQVVLRPISFTGILVNCGELIANGATLTNVTISSSKGISAYAPQSIDIATSLLIDGIGTKNYGIRLTANGNYSNIVGNLQNHAIADVKIDTGTTGAINLSGITFPVSGSTSPTNIRYEGTGTVTITVNRSGVTTTTPNGGTVILVTPLPTITITTNPFGARVGVVRQSDSLQILNTSSNATTGIATVAYTGSIPATVLVYVRLAGYEDHSSIQTITSAGLTLAISLPVDNKYNPSY